MNLIAFMTVEYWRLCFAFVYVLDMSVYGYFNMHLLVTFTAYEICIEMLFCHLEVPKNN